MGDTLAAVIVAKYSQNDFADPTPGENANSVELFKNLSKEILLESEETNL